VTLVDLHGKLVTAADQVGWREVHPSGWTEVRDVPGAPGSAFVRPARQEVELLGWTDVQDVEMTPGTGFVSPANSLGFMDGGIDYVLSRVMFPGVEAQVKDAIASHKCMTLLGRAYLPIGRAVVVPTQHEGVKLVAAPTMWLPQDVRGTHNAYHAMYAALDAATRDGGIRRLVVPGLGTGCGRLSAEEAVAQMRDAHCDFVAGRGPRFSAGEIEAEQPNWYENTEFKPVPAKDVCIQREGGLGVRMVSQAVD
jgi:O-acetyl-ADP-ribose deacetylase (regulator of RNase III)